MASAGPTPVVRRKTTRYVSVKEQVWAEAMKQGRTEKEIDVYFASYAFPKTQRDTFANLSVDELQRKAEGIVWARFVPKTVGRFPGIKPVVLLAGASAPAVPGYIFNGADDIDDNNPDPDLLSKKPGFENLKREREINRRPTNGRSDWQDQPSFFRKESGPATVFNFTFGGSGGQPSSSATPSYGDSRSAPFKGNKYVPGNWAPKPRQQKAMVWCRNCDKDGHEAKDCIVPDQYGTINACPEHNTKVHNLWTCPTPLKLSRLVWYLLQNRNGKPQMAWGEDITKVKTFMDYMLDKRVRPMTREGVMDMTQNHPGWHSDYVYHTKSSEDCTWNDDRNWSSRRILGQTHPNLKNVQSVNRQGTERRRSRSPVRDRERDQTNYRERLGSRRDSKESHHNGMQWDIFDKYPEDSHQMIKLERTAAELFSATGKVSAAEYEKTKIVYDTDSAEFYNLADYRVHLRKVHHKEIIDRLVGDLIQEERDIADVKSANNDRVGEEGCAEVRVKRENSLDGDGVGGWSGGMLEH